MSDTIVAEHAAGGEGSPVTPAGAGDGPIMIARPQITDDQKSSLRMWAEDVCSATGEVLSTLAGREIRLSVGSEPPVALTLAGGRWIKADIFIPTGALTEPGQGLVLFSESDGCRIVDLAGGGDGGDGLERLDTDAQQLLEEVMSQVVGVIAREGGQLGATVTWGGLDLMPHSDLGDLLTGGWAVARMLVTVDGVDCGHYHTALCKTAITHLSSRQTQTATPPALAPQAAPPAPVAVPRPSPGPQPQGSVVVQAARFKALDDSQTEGSRRNLDIIVDVPLQLTVELGRTTQKIRDVLALSPGAVVELDRLAGEAVDVLVNGKLVAKGEVVVIDENFGVRITDIVSPMERVTNVG